MKKKILSLVLCLCMIIGLMPVGHVHAEGLNYLALGDSITTGAELPDTSKSFVNILAKDNGYTVTNKASANYTSGDLLNQVKGGSLDDAIKSASVITITATGNDLMNFVYDVLAEEYNKDNDPDVTGADIPGMLTGGYADAIVESAMDVCNADMAERDDYIAAVDAMISNINATVAYIKGINSSVLVVVCNQYSPFLHFGFPYSIVNNAVEACAEKLNTNLSSAASSNNYKIADAYTTFVNADSADGDTALTYGSASPINLSYNPTPAGHVAIAEAFQKVLDANHIHSYTSVVTAPTCTAKGYTTYTCACGESYTADEVAATGHTEVIDAAVAATCTTDGKTEGKHCSVCKTVIVAQETIPAAHTEEVIKGYAATCSEDGLTDGKKCSVCGEITVAQETIPAAHTEVIDAAVAATCTETGLTEGKHCSACNLVLVKQEEVPATGHTEVVDKAVAATCTAEGKTEGSHCSACGLVIVAQESVPATGHTEVADEPVEATCTTDGKTGGSHCSVCNAVIDAAEIIPATGHTEVIDEAVAATCTEDGLTEGKHCSVCNTVITAQETVKAAGHTEVIDAAVAATCTEDGLTEGKHCSVCNTVITAQETVEATGHTEVIDEAVAATCTTDGKTQGSHCSVCNEVIVAQNTVAATGHTEVADAAVAATCTTDGKTAGSHCSVCEAVIEAQETIPATGHTEVVDKGIPATCTDNGLTEGSHCSVCNAIIVEQEVIPAAHTFGEWVTVKEPTTEEEGLQERTCSVCGEKESKVLDKLTEEPDPSEPSEPSDPTGPSDPTDPSEPSDPTEPSEPDHEHEYGQWTTEKDPTSTEDGLESRVCGCGKSELRVIPKLSNPFTDVKEGDYFYEPVLWASYKKITTGMTATEFGPQLSCTRGHIVTFLYRAFGEPEVKTTKNPFSDVSESAFYYKAVLWAVENGITTGMSANTFAPNATCTRAQAVTFLYRAFGEPGFESDATDYPFTDVDVNAYYYEAVLWAVENGVTTGMGNGKFAPNATCTRGQIVTFLYRAAKK